MNSAKPDIKVELEKHGERLIQYYFSSTFDSYALKTSTFESNTARAFHYGKCYMIYQPISIYRHWIHHHYLGNPKTIQLLKEGTDFEMIHKQAVDRLRRFWRRTEPEIQSMEYYYFAKMIDLFFKGIPRWDQLTTKRREWFFSRVHVPIDKYSLQVLNQYHPDYNIKNSSMNYVGNNVRLYKKIQSDIKKMIAPFPPLLFDIYAWDHLRSIGKSENATFDLKLANKK